MDQNDIRRRRFLAAVATIPALGIVGSDPALAGEPRRLTETSAASNRGGSLDETSPSKSTDAFLLVDHSSQALQQRMGWEAATLEQVAESILRIGPDLLNELDLAGWHSPNNDRYAPRHAEVRSFAREHRFPYVLGVHYHINSETLHDDWYQHLPDDERWEHPDGTPVEHPFELVARNFDGTPRMPHGQDDPRRTISPSHLAPGTRDRLVRTGREIFEWGATEFWIDSPVEGLSLGLDFSEWAQAAFRNYLTDHSNDRLEELDIDDIESFDIISHIEDAGIAPSETDSPAEDPVFREYLRFQHVEQRRLISEVFERSRSQLSAAERERTTVFGLGFGLQHDWLDPACIYKSDFVDVISIETKPTVPPNRPHDVSVKIGRAAGRFEKPVRVWGRMVEGFGTAAGLDPTENYPTLLRFHLAQAYANGGRRSMPLTGLPNYEADQSVNSWLRSDGTVPDSLTEFVDFVRAHERLLTDVEEASDTAVVVSLPTLLWTRAPEWEARVTDHSHAIGEAAEVLRQEHVPYDVCILDYPPLWDAQEQTERLREYDRIVLPGVECVSDAHRNGIQAALETGTEVIVTGDTPTRDEEYRPRSDMRSLLRNADGARILDTDPEPDAGGRSAARLADAVAERSPPIETDLDHDIGITTFEQPDRTVVHFVNYEYDPERDVVTDIPRFDAVIDIESEPAAVTFHSVDGVRRLEATVTDAGLAVTVPEIKVWGILVLGETEGATMPSTDRETALETIENARDLIDQANDRSQRGPVRRAIATADNAERMLEYEAYGVARSLASDAADLVEPLIENTANAAEESDEGDADHGTDSEPSPESDSGGDDADPNSEDEIPGFGVPATLASFGGLSYVLKRHLDEE